MATTTQPTERREEIQSINSQQPSRLGLVVGRTGSTRSQLGRDDDIDVIYAPEALVNFCDRRLPGLKKEVPRSPQNNRLLYGRQIERGLACAWSDTALPQPASTGVTPTRTIS
jgi:hypothetical protein